MTMRPMCNKCTDRNSSKYTMVFSPMFYIVVVQQFFHIFKFYYALQKKQCNFFEALFSYAHLNVHIKNATCTRSTVHVLGAYKFVFVWKNKSFTPYNNPLLMITYNIGLKLKCRYMFP